MGRRRKAVNASCDITPKQMILKAETRLFPITQMPFFISSGCRFCLRPADVRIFSTCCCTALLLKVASVRLQENSLTWCNRLFDDLIRPLQGPLPVILANRQQQTTHKKKLSPYWCIFFFCNKELINTRLQNMTWLCRRPANLRYLLSNHTDLNREANNLCRWTLCSRWIHVIDRLHTNLNRIVQTHQRLFVKPSPISVSELH